MISAGFNESLGTFRGNIATGMEDVVGDEGDDKLLGYEATPKLP